MKQENNNKLVLFGAGKIGRSFIGQLFSRGGYEVVFVDIFKPVIDELNHRREYDIVIKGDTSTVLTIRNVRAVFAGDTDQVTAEVATARIVAVSVGINGLKSVVSLIAKGLLKRYEQAGASPLDIIIAENLRNAARLMHDEIKSCLPVGYPIDERLGLIETSIGKMVPIMPKKEVDKDMLRVFAEPYNTLILDKLAFKNPIPDIEGLAPKENMKAWVDRKLFIHNLGHATAAYLGYVYHPASTFLYEILSDEGLMIQVRNTMLQAADILLTKYPDEFTAESLSDHIDDLLSRFKNKALGDTLFRVGCDLPRKLGAQDRLAGAIHLAKELHLPYHLILKTLVFAFHFKATDEEGKRLPADLEFEKIYQKGIRTALTTVCGFNDQGDQEIIEEAERLDNELKSVKLLPKNH